MSGDEKLRRLREWIRSHVFYPLPDSPAGQLSIESVLFKIDRMLAEPEEAKLERRGECSVNPTMVRACNHGTPGCIYEHFTERHYRETLAEEVARLHGYTGPDGRGRP